MNIQSAILVGGASRRMRQPKQLLEWQGETWLERIRRTLLSVTEEVWLVGGGPLPPVARNWPRLPDACGIEGPLAGIIAALEASPRSSWLIVACDQPLLHVAALNWLLVERRPDSLALMPHLSGSDHLEPLLAIYEPAILPVYRQQVAAGDFCPLTPRASGRIVSPAIPPALAEAWTNFNSFQDLERMNAG